jgi:hypothetical protein
MFTMMLILVSNAYPSDPEFLKYWRVMDEKIYSVAKKKNVRLAIMVTWKGSNGREEKGYAGIREDVYAKHFLDVFSEVPKFTIVSRSQLEKVFAEQKLSLTGAIQEGIQIGKILGATHILVIDCVPFYAPVNGSVIKFAGWRESGNLIDVENSIVPFAFSEYYDNDLINKTQEGK